MEEIDKIRAGMMDKRLDVLYKHALRYLNSIFEIELDDNYKSIKLENNKFITLRFKSSAPYFYVSIQFTLYGAFESVEIKGSTRDGNITIYHQYVNKIVQNKTDFIEDMRIRQMTHYFIKYKKFINYVIQKYNRLYKTQYYNNLNRITTFLLICKQKPIFPKDIYLLIAKKILFFVFPGRPLASKKKIKLKKIK